MARIKVNKEVSMFIACNSGAVVRYLELKINIWRYLRGDGVHINAVGIDLWALGLQDGIQIHEVFEKTLGPILGMESSRLVWFSLNHWAAKW